MLRQGAEAAVGESLAETAAPGKGKNIGRARSIIAAVSIERWKVNANLMAKLLRRWPGAVSHWAKGVGAMIE